MASLFSRLFSRNGHHRAAEPEPPPAHPPGTVPGLSGPIPAALARDPAYRALRESVAAHEKRLAESFELPGVPWWGRAGGWDRWGADFERGGYPRGWWGPPADRAQDKTHAPLPHLTEVEWREHVAMARDLLTRNPAAVGFLAHLAAFVGPVSTTWVLRGQTPGASASGPADADGDGAPDVDPLVAEVTQAWEEWAEANDWGQGAADREAECLERFCGEGEVTTRHFRGRRGGVPAVRVVEPELIRTPPGEGLQGPRGWGVETDPADADAVLALWLLEDPDDPADVRRHDAGRFVRATANVPRSVKRGLSDFFCLDGLLRKVVEVRENVAVAANTLSKILWWEQYPSASRAQVEAMLAERREPISANWSPAAPGGTSAFGPSGYEHTHPGTVVRTEHGREVFPTPAMTNSEVIERVDALVMRAVAFRFGLPPNFAGQGGDSFASALVNGSPFVRIIEQRQRRWQGFARAVACKVVELCEESGRLPAGTLRAVRPVCTSPPVVIADEEKQARTFLALYEKGVADPYAYIRERGEEPKVVMANYAAHQRQVRQTQGPPPGSPPAGPGGAPPGPNATPPGSAGGDGSSPNANPFGEALSDARRRRLSEAGRAGLVAKKVTDKNGVERTVWVRAGTAAGSEREPAAPGDAEAAVAKAFREPGSLTAAEAKALAKQVAGLPKERLRQLALAARQRIGPTKAAIADRLLKQVRAGQKTRKRAAGPELRGQALRQKALELGFPDYGVKFAKPADLAARVRERLEAREKLARAADDAGPIDLARVREISDLAAAAHENFKEQNAAVTEYCAKALDRNARPTEPVAVHGMATAEGDRSVEVFGAPWVFSDATRDAAAKSLAWAATAEAPPAAVLAATRRVVFTTQTNKDNDHWRKKYDDPNLVATATGGDGTVCVYGGMTASPGTLSHEGGHNLATAVFGGTSPTPDSEYGRAQAEEPPVTEYGSKSAAEDFAEAVAAYSRPGEANTYSRDGVAYNRGELRERFPKKYAALEKIMNQYGGGT